MSITSHQVKFDQLEMLCIVHFKGKILHAVSFMIHEQVFHTCLMWSRAVGRFQLQIRESAP